MLHGYPIRLHFSKALITYKIRVYTAQKIFFVTRANVTPLIKNRVNETSWITAKVKIMSQTINLMKQIL
jgi:hypothetical protein